MLSHYSYSTLVMADQCPRRFAWVKLEGNSEPSTEAAARGQLVHELVEEYSRHCVRHRYDRDRTLAVVMADRVEDPYVAAIVRALPDTITLDPGMVIADGEGVEREWEYPLSDGTPMKGRFDRLDWNEAEAEAVVVDYKSGSCWAFPTEPPRQLRIYGWAAAQMLPQAQIITLRLVYLGSRTEHEWYLGRDDELLSDGWIVEWVKDARRLEQRSEHREKPGSWCAWCGRLVECAKGRAQRERAICTEEEAQAACEDALVLETAATRLRQGVDRWRRENGVLALAAGDMLRGDWMPAWAEKGEQHFDLRDNADAAEFVRALREAGQDPVDYLSVNAGKLGRLLGQVGEGDTEENNPFVSAGELAAGKVLLKMLKPVTPNPTAGWRKARAGGETDAG